MKKIHVTASMKNDYVVKFRRALHQELEKDFNSAMISWAIAELAAPTKKEADRCRDRKISCLKQHNNIVNNSTFSDSNEEHHKYIKEEYD
ncbi:hypothetical protein [Vibrio harveyi]|uniref:hypothetical protein n=1 Tax=Vibrio harveyi TaxID=669 RepID=UPI000682805D|nr:hypothetical protein [Vibrio harveyi]